MTRFAAGLAEARRLGEPGAPKIPLKIVAQGEKVAIRPFVVEFVAVAHSIPESSALAIRTPAGLIVHTADWKIDPSPIIGPPTDEARLKALGDEGVLALICDSTDILREGESPSERDVAKTLAWLIGEAKGRVVVTTFASNVARLRAAAEAGFAAGRQVSSLGARSSASSPSPASAGCSTACRSSWAWTPSTACRGTRSWRSLPAARAAARRARPDCWGRASDRGIGRWRHGNFFPRTIPGNEKRLARSSMRL